jgi:hypothetical protein
MEHRSQAELEAGLPTVMAAPRDTGALRLVVRRIARGEREILEVGELDERVGLVGDDWVKRPSRSTGRPDPRAQLTIMNAGNGAPDTWAPAGDQLYLDLDLSEENLPAGSRLGVGSAVIEIQAQPHTGCAQFVERFGTDAMLLANSERGRKLRLRGANAVVVQGGIIRTGDLARKL